MGSQYRRSWKLDRNKSQSNAFQQLVSDNEYRQPSYVPPNLERG